MSIVKLISDEFKNIRGPKEEKCAIVLAELLALNPAHLGLCMVMFTLINPEIVVVGKVSDFVLLLQKGDTQKSADYFCDFFGENSEMALSLAFIDVSQNLFATLFTTRLDGPFETLVKLVLKTYLLFQMNEPIIQKLEEIYEMVGDAIANVIQDAKDVAFLKAPESKMEYHALFLTLIVGTITADLEESKKFIQLYVSLVGAQLEIDEESELRISLIDHIVKGYSDQNLTISQFFESKKPPAKVLLYFGLF